ncbi:MAG TPA: prolyl oligopeptidase family serine peptidase [Planctomycetota bacterium]|nr:prolyl oligopeptidase family serine peptidase [Planctomycetota bacterium]
MPTLALFLVLAAFDGDRDNHPERVRPIPLPGIAVPAEVRTELEGALVVLGKEIDQLQADLKGQPALLDLLPDVQIFHKAVHVALADGEFHDPKEFDLARGQLQEGRRRARMLRDGTPEWTTSPGPHPRGYVSAIDGSIQPYGFVLPEGFRADPSRKRRLDTWFHGRMEHLSELNFIDWAGVHFDDSVRIAGGPFTPADALVLQLYGRFCNASKFAGEAEFFEAMDWVKRRYPVDDDRIVIRGFSMGGAASWHLGAHYAGRWAAVAPGAGFAETAEFLRVFQKETLTPTPVQRKLWHWYDATDYAVNFSNTTLVAYSGERDPQKQAADMMAKALAEEGLELEHLIGPNTGHQYHPEVWKELVRRVDDASAKGRDPHPRRIRFTTWTLRYNDMKWVTVDGLGHHWERARVDAEQDGGVVTATTSNVTAISFDLPSLKKVVLDGTELPAAPHYVKKGAAWAAGSPEGLVKRHGLQGPIDDAFLSGFLVVTPTGKPLNDRIGAWVAEEQKRAVLEWRRQFRGDARVTTDEAVTPDDLARFNLVLWGDPSSNRLLAKIAGQLPIRWGAKELQVGAESFSSDTHVPILVYPNPLNPAKYVVLNSGFTYREYDYLNNARQVPRLPDWAVIDLRTPPGTQWPGNIVSADFFQEHWELK